MSIRALALPDPNRAVGGAVVMMEGFDAEAVLSTIERYCITHAQFVPTHFIRMLRLSEDVKGRYDLGSLKTAVHAAAPCPPAVKHRMMAWWGPILHEYHGGSERCGLTAFGPQEWRERPGSVGTARMRVVHIVDPETKAPVPPGQYHKDPLKTRDARTEDGWGAYGDAGWVDEAGCLFLADRQSHLIISGGVNIYPQEIENVLLTHPGVADVAVIGAPNEDFGEEVKAVVVASAPESGNAKLAAELTALCRAELAGFKRPRSVDFVPESPRHPNGKLLKRELRERYWPAAAF